jgi:hypothetical protein
MREWKFGRVGGLRLEPLEDRSLPSATPFPELVYLPEDQSEYAFVDGTEAGDAIVGDEPALECEMQPFDGEVMTDPEYAIGEPGFGDCWIVGFCGTPPLPLEDWCGTTTTEEVTEPPSLDGINIVVDWMDPDPGYEIIGLPTESTEEEALLEAPAEEVTTYLAGDEAEDEVTIYPTGEDAEADDLAYLSFPIPATAGSGDTPEESVVTASSIDESPLAAALVGNKTAPAFVENPEAFEAEPALPLTETADVGSRGGEGDEPTGEKLEAPDAETAQLSDGFLETLDAPL